MILSLSEYNNYFIDTFDFISLVLQFIIRADMDETEDKTSSLG